MTTLKVAFVNLRKFLLKFFMAVNGQCCLLTVTYVPTQWETAETIKHKIPCASRQSGRLEEGINNLTLPGIETGIQCWKTQVNILPDSATNMCDLPNGKDPVPNAQGRGRSLWVSGRAREISYPPGFDSRTTQTQPTVIPTDQSCPSRNNKPHQEFIDK